MSLPALPLNAWLRWDLVRRLLPAGARTILEIGCGQGAMGARLALDHDYLGVEPDGTSFATAQSRLTAVGRGEVRNGMVDDVVPAGEVFDLVCAFEVLEHLEDDAGALAEWSARVRPGGWLMMSSPAFQSRYSYFDKVAGHYRRYEPMALKQLFEDTGLVEVEVVAYGAGLGQMLETARNVVGRRILKTGASGAGGGHGSIASGVITPPTAEEIAASTTGSGRLLQPPAALGLLTQAASAPFRQIQRRFPTKGTGLVARGRKPVTA